MNGGRAVKSRQVFLVLLIALVVAGLGGTALAHNPAAVDTDGGFAVGISLYGETASNSFGYRLLGLLNKHWTEEQRLAVAQSIAEDGLMVNVYTDPGVYVQYNNFRIYGGAQGEAEVRIPRELAELAFKGVTLEELEAGDAEIDLAGVQGQGGAYAQGGLSAAFSLAQFVDLPVEDVVVGISGRYLYGLAYGETDFNGTIAYFEDDGGTRVVSRDLDVSVLHSQKGQGWAFDAGIAAQITPRLGVDVSVENIGQVVWTDVKERRWSKEGEWDLARVGYNSETNEFEFEFADGEELGEEEGSAEDITWKLPVRVRFGLEYAFDKQVTLRGSARHTRYESGTSDTLFGGEVEYRPLPFIPITVGASYSQKTQLMLDAGVGVHFDQFELQLAAKNLHSLVLKEGKGLGLALTLGLHF